MAQSNGKPDRTDLDTLKRTLSLVDVATSYGMAVKPVSGGSKNHVVPCPFHADKEASLSMHQNVEGKWLWNCFGCKTGGDVLSFIQLFEKVDFKAALIKLRSLAGTLPPAAVADADPVLTRDLPPGQSRHQLLTAVMAHYQKRFSACPEARAYLESRGLGSDPLQQTFGLGYADGSLLPTLPRNGDVRHGLSALGVLNEHGREHFKGCVVVPLFHPDDGLVGLYGRRIDPEARNRHLYLPGPQRGVLNWQALQTAPAVYLTEGILDALSLWVAGVSDVSCVFSAQGMPADVDDLLRRYTVREVKLCLDSDGPGREAASRFHSDLEARGVSVHRVELPEKDANQLLVQRGAEALRQAVQAAPQTQARTRSPIPVQTSAAHPDSFSVELDDVRYQVTARPPFTERLRILLKAWYGDAHHPETLDLYNGRNRTMTVNALHRVFGIDKGTLETHLLKILEATEAWLTQQTGGGGASLAKPPAPVTLTETEREEAMAFLTQPDLVGAILSDMAALGSVGEEDAKLMVYLIGTSRKQKKPLAGVVLSQSGAGKSSLIALTQVLMPPEDVVYFSRVSATAPGYMDRYAVKHKLLMFDERAGSEAADYQIRSLLSQGMFKQGITSKDPLTGKMTVVENEVEGPIALLETTTLPDLNDENASRVFELTMTETEAQTARIHAYQRFSVSPAGLEQQSERDAICRRHHLAQRLLEPMAVAIPYADRLSFPTRWLRTRRDHARFLNLVLASAFLHQFQRPRGVLPKTGEVYVVATAADYRLAYTLARTVLSATLHDLPQSCQELWTGARAMLALRTQGGKVFDTPFTRRELRVHIGWPDRRLRENLDKLVELEYVAATPGSQGKTYHYTLLPGGDEGAPLDMLLTPEALEGLLESQQAA